MPFFQNTSEQSTEEKERIIKKRIRKAFGNNDFQRAHCLLKENETLLDGAFCYQLIMDVQGQDSREVFIKAEFLFNYFRTLPSKDVRVYNAYIRVATDANLFNVGYFAFTEARVLGLADVDTYHAAMGLADKLGSFALVKEIFNQGVQLKELDADYFKMYMTIASNKRNYFGEVHAAFMSSIRLNLADSGIYGIYLISANYGQYLPSERVNALYNDPFKQNDSHFFRDYMTFIERDDNCNLQAVCNWGISPADGYMAYLYAATHLENVTTQQFARIEEVFNRANRSNTPFYWRLDLYTFYFKAAYKAGVFEEKVGLLSCFSFEPNLSFVEVSTKQGYSVLQLDCRNFSALILCFMLKAVLSYTHSYAEIIVELGSPLHFRQDGFYLVDAFHYFVDATRKVTDNSLRVESSPAALGTYILSGFDEPSFRDEIQMMPLPDIDGLKERRLRDRRISDLFAEVEERLNTIRSSESNTADDEPNRANQFMSF